MTKCPKCSSYRISGPNYDPRTDRQGYRCRRCGYRTSRLPDDRKEGGRPDTLNPRGSWLLTPYSL